MDHLSEWKEGWGVDSAEWYPSDNDAVNVAWCSFMAKRTAGHALTAIKAILNAGLAMPEELIPFMQDALNVWINPRGHKQPPGIKLTDDGWQDLIWEVHLRRMKGEKRNDAINAVADKRFKGRTTLKGHYKSSRNDVVKESVFIGLCHELLQPEISQNAQVLSAFMDRYPNFIKELNSRL